MLLKSLSIRVAVVQSFSTVSVKVLVYVSYDVIAFKVTVYTPTSLGSVTVIVASIVTGLKLIQVGFEIAPTPAFDQVWV